MASTRMLVWLGAGALLLVGGCKAKNQSPTAAASTATEGSAASQPAAATVASVAGDYITAWGACTLTQTGPAVAGVCRARGTVLTCQVQAEALHCNWTEPANRAGKADLRRQPDGRLVGTYGTGASATNGGPWNFTPRG